MMNADQKAELKKLKAEVGKLRAQAEAESTSKDVAGKAIGKHGLAYITLIVIIGVGASIFLDEQKIAAVIGLVSAALTALIAMLSGIAEADREEKEELRVIEKLIDKMDRDPMNVDVSGSRVTVSKGTDTVTTEKGDSP